MRRRTSVGRWERLRLRSVSMVGSSWEALCEQSWYAPTLGLPRRVRPSIMGRATVSDDSGEGRLIDFGGRCCHSRIGKKHGANINASLRAM